MAFRHAILGSAHFQCNNIRWYYGKLTVEKDSFNHALGRSVAALRLACLPVDLTFDATVRRMIRLSFAFAAVLLLDSIGRAGEVPHLSGRVNDYAGILTTGERVELKEILASNETETSHQAADPDSSAC